MSKRKNPKAIHFSLVDCVGSSSVERVYPFDTLLVKDGNGIAHLAITRTSRDEIEMKLLRPLVDVQLDSKALEYFVNRASA